MANSRIARLRLFNQRISDNKLSSPGEVVRWMGAVQCQDLLAGQWAVALRTRGQTLEDVERAVAQKKIVRTWPMRGTLHFVPPSDVRWMLKYLAQKSVHRASSRHKQLHLDGPTFSRSARIFEKTLEGGKQIGRFQAYELLERNGISCKGQRGIHILGRLSQDGLLCLGPRDGTSTTFVLLDEWIPPSKIPPRDEAIMKLALQYFTSHGPATVGDFAWWSSLALTEARSAVEEIKSRLNEETIAGTTYWFAHTAKVSDKAVSEAHLLPAFDEFLVAYKDRTFAVTPEHLKRTHPGGGILNPTVVIGNQIVATWGRTMQRDRTTVHIRPFRALSRREFGFVEEAAESYGSFLRKHVVVRMNK